MQEAYHTLVPEYVRETADLLARSAICSVPAAGGGHRAVTLNAMITFQWLHAQTAEGAYEVRAGGIWLRINDEDLASELGISSADLADALVELTDCRMCAISLQGLKLPQLDVRLLCVEERYKITERLSGFRLPTITRIHPRSNPKPVSRKTFVARFNATCVYCKGTGTETKGPDGKSWHRDHVYPKHHGGADNLTNLVLSCATCNMRKHTMAANEFLAKLAAETV
jgi:hypothetical protein